MFRIEDAADFLLVLAESPRQFALTDSGCRKGFEHGELGCHVGRDRDLDEAAALGAWLWQRLTALQIAEKYKAKRLLSHGACIGFAPALRDRLGHIGKTCNNSA